MDGRILRAAWPLVLLAAALGAGAGWVLPSPGPAPPPASLAGLLPALPGAPAAPPGPDPSAPTATAPALGPDTVIRYQRLYRVCHRVEEVELPAPPALHGLTAPDLPVYYRQWRVVSFTPELVVLAAETDAMCPEMQYWRHIRLSGGEVTVYWGRRGQLGPVLERTGIMAEMLAFPERLRLEEGVDLAGDAAVQEFLGH